MMYRISIVRYIVKIGRGIMDWIMSTHIRNVCEILVAHCKDSIFAVVLEAGKFQQSRTWGPGEIFWDAGVWKINPSGVNPIRIPVSLDFCMLLCCSWEVNTDVSIRIIPAEYKCTKDAFERIFKCKRRIWNKFKVMAQTTSQVVWEAF